MPASNPMLVSLTKAISVAMPQSDWNTCASTAVAALQALREPSPEMLETAFPGMPSHGYVREDWQLMVDAILAGAADGPSVAAFSPGR
jgi:hypothetical protein